MIMKTLDLGPDPYPYLLEMLDPFPDPDSMDPDPQLCCRHRVFPHCTLNNATSNHRAMPHPKQSNVSVKPIAEQ